MMKILALENSTKQGSIAFLGEESEPIVFEFSNDRKHSGAFFQSLESLSHRFRKIDSIIVGLGPGSYVGIRIAIGAAIGLERASGARLVGLASGCLFATRAN